MREARRPDVGLTCFAGKPYDGAIPIELGAVMSEKNMEGSNVLPFKRVAKRPSAAATAAEASTELKELLIVYDRLIALLRETDNDGLDALTDDLVISVVHYRKALTEGIDAQTGPAMVKEMKEGLRQIPGSLRSLLPGLGPRLGESLEGKLGIRFSGY
jgi:hypothetical protein